MDELITTLKTFWPEVAAIIILTVIGIFLEALKKRVADFACFVIRIMKTPAKCAFETSIMGKLDKIQSELKPNGGSSLRDAINRIDIKLTNVSNKINIIQASADITSDTLNICRWAADKNGLLNFVNRPFKKLLGVVDDESCLGDAWITNTVHEEDRPTTQAEWNRAVSSKSEYHHTFRIVNASTGEIIKVTNHARLVIDDHGNVGGWVGVVIPHNK